MDGAISPDLRAQLTLHLVPGIGPRLTAALLNRFGSAAAVLRATAEQLCEVPHIGGKTAGELHRAMRTADVSGELESMARHGVRLLALGTTDYPAALAEIGDPPHLLFVRGTLTAADAKSVALVGPRHCSSYGRRIAERLATGLVQRGYTVVSGLARGIDGVAHRAALKAGGRTVAVLAGGLSRIYPPEHAELAAEVQSAGALISEASMSMQPMAGMFPARNRLISGLSRAVVVIEAAERSGALITAQHAAEQGRPALAVPGSIDSPTSGGTNRLIRQGAVLVRGVDDIIEELEGPAAVPASKPAPAPPPDLTEPQRRIWDFIGDQPKHIDDMARRLEMPVSTLSSTLMILEMKKLIRRLPGNFYERSA